MTERVRVDVPLGRQAKGKFGELRSGASHGVGPWDKILAEIAEMGAG